MVATPARLRCRADARLLSASATLSRAAPTSARCVWKLKYDPSAWRTTFCNAALWVRSSATAAALAAATVPLRPPKSNNRYDRETAGVIDRRVPVPPSVWPTVVWEYAELTDASTAGRYAALVAP